MVSVHPPTVYSLLMLILLETYVLKFAGKAVLLTLCIDISIVAECIFTNHTLYSFVKIALSIILQCWFISRDTHAQNSTQG